eukprot:TRINITY_DN63273_c0_g1_i1.p1 TRINITY_DN63273_c0_g1~~TRINITY_DN63273_c0_g1_i1.p1  ORF type:complete len:480 (-),score=121.80 TRINITY_DN63273_c0_g1_i1:53-1492(-)
MSGTSAGPGVAHVQGGADALIAAREHLAAVVQDLSALQQKIDCVTDEEFEAVGGSGASNDVAFAGDFTGGGSGGNARAATPSRPGSHAGSRPLSRQSRSRGSVGDGGGGGFAGKDAAIYNLEKENLELQRGLRHLQIDRDAAASRADRLASENQLLLQSHTRLEAELRKARQKLEDTRRKLRHQEVDLRQLKKAPSPRGVASQGAAPAQAPTAATQSSEAATTPPSKEAPSPSGGQQVAGGQADHDGAGSCSGGHFADSGDREISFLPVEQEDHDECASGKPSDVLGSQSMNVLAHAGPLGMKKADASQPKQRIAAMLKACQAELREERRQRERAEKRHAKDRERLERLTALAERQRDDIAAMRERCLHVDEYARNCENRLRKSAAKTKVLHATLSGIGGVGSGSGLGVGLGTDMSDTSDLPVQQEVSAYFNTVGLPPGPSGSPSSGGGGGVGSVHKPMPRQHSAPTRLPSVPAGRASV